VTPSETAKVIMMVRAASPQQRLADEPTVLLNVWHSIIGDLPFAEVEKAVIAHYRAATDPWITPGQIRRRVATTFGLLAPSEDEAWALAQRWSRREIRLDALPSAVGLACEAVAEVLRSEAPVGVRHSAFRDAYRASAQRHNERALEASAGSWDLLDAGARLALPSWTAS
jgi:hypothetical protein